MGHGKAVVTIDIDKARDGAAAWMISRGGGLFDMGHGQVGRGWWPSTSTRPWIGVQRG